MLQSAVHTTWTYIRLIIIGSAICETMSWEERFDEQNTPGLVDGYSISPIGHRAELGEAGREVRSGGVFIIALWTVWLAEKYNKHDS